MNDEGFANPLPLYHRVYLLLRQRIAEGAWPPSQPMPGEHELAAMHDVSRITVRRALERLEAEGLIVRRRGAGTFTRPPVIEKRRENLRGLLENLVMMGVRTQVRLLDFAYLPAPPEIAEALELAPGAIVQKSERIRSMKGVPFSHLTTWVPEHIGRHYRPEDLATRPLLGLLQEAGVPPARASQLISAKLADSNVAPLLTVEPGSPLLWTRRQVRDTAGQVIEWIEALYRPEMYEYQISMVRRGVLWSHSDAEPMADDVAAEQPRRGRGRRSPVGARL